MHIFELLILIRNIMIVSHKRSGGRYEEFLNVQEIKITLLITNVHKFVIFPIWKIVNGLPIYILIALTMTMNNSKN